MGRRRKTTQLRSIEGGRDRRPKLLVDGEPVAHGHLIDPPSWLSDDQKKDWAWAIQHAPYGLLRHIDAEMLASWCVAADIRRKASVSLSNSSMLIRSANGSPVPSPYIRIINQQATVMKALAVELGFSPAARTSIAIAEQAEADPADKYFND